MKRRRRIEVIRYRRTVTARPGAAPAPAEPEDDLIREALAAIPQFPPAPSDCDGNVVEPTGDHAPRRGLLSVLGGLLRLRR